MTRFGVPVKQLRNKLKCDTDVSLVFGMATRIVNTRTTLVRSWKGHNVRMRFLRISSLRVNSAHVPYRLVGRDSADALE